MKYVECPCKDCPDRYCGCHANCSKYLEYRKYRDELIEKRKNERLGDAPLSIYKNKKKPFTRKSGY